MPTAVTPQLAYRGLEPVNPLTLAGRSVAKGVAITVLVASLVSLPALAQSPVATWFGGYANLGGQGLSLPDWFLGFAQVLPWLVFLSDLALVLCSVGLLARGHRFRRMLVIVVFATAALTLCYTLVNLIVGWLLIRRAGVPWPQLVMYVSPFASGIVVLPLLVLAGVLLSRRWMHDALLDGVAEASGFTLRLAAGISILLGVLGLLNNGLPLLSSKGKQLNFLRFIADVRIGTELRGFNPIWTSISQWSLVICAATALIGGVMLLGMHAGARRALVNQARVAVIVNVVTLFFGVMLLGIYSTTGFGASMATTLVMRMASLVVNASLWIYLGSAAVVKMMSPPPAEVPVACLAEESHAISD